jgi:hypothetical protein
VALQDLGLESLVGELQLGGARGHAPFQLLVQLLDVSLLTQLGGLERRTVRSGRDLVDHAPNAHDDVANAAAGAVILVCGASTSALQVFAVDVGKSGTSPHATPSYGPRVTAFVRGE